MKKTMKIILLAIFGGVGISSAQTQAVISSDKLGWHKIGETTVDFKKDRDEIIVMGADRFASIQFKVIDAPIDLIDLEVFYESGDKQKISVRTPIQKGGESRVIDLNGGERSLKKIVFVYKTLPNNKDEKAHVEIWGVKTNSDEKSMTGAATGTEASLMATDKKGWHKIGEKSIDFVNDKDEFIVIGEDRFSSIKFYITDASVHMINLTVTYETGDKQNIPINSLIVAGGESKSIALSGSDRELKKIAFEYKTLQNKTAQKATIEVWGQKTKLVVN